MRSVEESMVRQSVISFRIADQEDGRQDGETQKRALQPLAQKRARLALHHLHCREVYVGRMAVEVFAELHAEERPARVGGLLALVELAFGQHLGRAQLA